MQTKVAIAGTVIKDNSGRYLLVQERKRGAYGLWNFPGGHVDEGESLEDAALRETYEEVGLKVKIVGPAPIFEADIKGVDHHYYAFRAEIVNGKLNIREDELLDAMWYYPRQIKELERRGLMRDPLTLQAILKVESNENNRY